MNPPIPDRYDPSNARELCAAAAAAYDSRDAFCLTQSASGDWILAFPGTRNARNVLTDLDARQIGFGMAKAHEGFVFAWQSIKPQVADAIAGKDVWITGHSLGGALAILCAHEFWWTNVVGVYTFGQPRVFSALGRADYNSFARKFTWRVTHHLDVVPHVPWLLRKFLHAGHEAWYMANDPHSVILDRTFRQYAGADLSALLEVARRPEHIEQWLADHHVSTYQALFEITQNAQPGGLGNSTLVPVPPQAAQSISTP